MLIDGLRGKQVNIFDTARLKPVPRMPAPVSSVIGKALIADKRPILFEGVADVWPWAGEWTFDHIASVAGEVIVSRPSDDGIYRYHQFGRMSFAEFAETLETSKDVYMGLNPMYRDDKSPHAPPELLPLAARLTIPNFIDPEKLHAAYLWIGPGENKTLLHYDPWGGLLVVLEGSKRLALFPPDQTPNMYGYSLLDAKSLFENKVLDSEIVPSEVDVERYPKIAEAEGYDVTVNAGEAVYLPAGTWHYVESYGRNVAVNFFWRDSTVREQLSRPLRDWRIKASIVDTKYAAVRFLRTYVVPKRERPASAE